MVSIDTLVHEMNVAAARAAQLRAFGEYDMADHFDAIAVAASDAIERRGAVERAVVREVGVS